jgi:hypothetical protein
VTWTFTYCNGSALSLQVINPLTVAALSVAPAIIIRIIDIRMVLNMFVLVPFIVVESF